MRMASNDLLAKVDAILEKSRKLAADTNEPNWHKSINEKHDMENARYQVYNDPKLNADTRTSNRTKIFAAMADRESLPTPKPSPQVAVEHKHIATPNAMTADLASLAARYSAELEKTSSQSYRNKVDIETLESARNDYKMKTEILERRLTNEAQRLMEKESTLSKVGIDKLGCI